MFYIYGAYFNFNFAGQNIQGHNFVEMFGKKVVLKKIQIADYLTTPFQFEGPMSIQNQLSFSMPDGSVKKIAAKPSKCIIRVLQDKIEVSTQIEFK